MKKQCKIKKKRAGVFISLSFICGLTCFLLFILFSRASHVGAAEEKTCRDCHPALSNGHEKHFSLPIRFAEYGNASSMNIAAGYSYNCGACHPLDSGRHRDKKLDIELVTPSANGLKALTKNGTFDPVAKTCLNVYCHYSKPTPAWGKKFEPNRRCQSCHDTPPAHDGHFNIAQGTGHLLGIHWDSTGGHGKDAKKEFMMGCNTCHYAVLAKEDTTFTHLAKGKQGIFSCNKCHSPEAGEIKDYSLHANGKTDIIFTPSKLRTKAQLLFEVKGWNRVIEKGSKGAHDETSAPLNTASYNRETKTCTNVACHLGAPVKWNEKVICSSCHKGY